MAKLPTNWFVEHVTPDLIQQFSIKDILYSGKTRFQTAEVIDTASYGRCLILDGKIQCSERDEFIYHEALVHPPLITHPNPETVFIAGGGEGATAREVLAHKTVSKAVMVDIDRQVIKLCRRYLPSLSQGSFEDERLELHFGDARNYLAHTQERFDAIIIDLPEPIEEGPAYLLYTEEFYAMLRERLRPQGVISVQSGCAVMGVLLNFIAVNNTLKTVFPRVFPYRAEVPSFGGTWGFALAGEGLDPLALSPAEVERRIAGRISRPLSFYDAETHRGLFSLPKYLRQEMAQENRTIADDRPLFIY